MSTAFRLPEGLEVDLKIYLTGTVQGEVTEIVITVGGLPAFAVPVQTVDVAKIVKEYELDKLGTDWRVMTREEIKAYRENER
jgi:hypothetical protein